MPEDTQMVDEIIRHYLETGEDTSRSEFAYKPPFPRPTMEELLAALSEEVRKREQGLSQYDSREFKWLNKASIEQQFELP